jgi:PAS domain-containing protein
VRLLANPMFLRMAAGLLLAMAAFFAAVLVMRWLRKRLVEEDASPDGLGHETTSYPFSAVIQQLKQQKFELQHEQQEQQRRAKTSEHVTAAVIAGLPCGVLFVAPNGLVRQANAAARQILGFASPLGMSVEEIFRDGRTVAVSGAWLRAADVIKNALRGQVRGTDLEFSYDTPARESRSLKLTLISLQTPTGEAVGVAAVITDQSASADRRRAELMRSEVSAEMALELYTSLANIRDWASRITTSNDPEFTANSANDISSEAGRLGKVVGGFLAAESDGKAMTARA